MKIIIKKPKSATMDSTGKESDTENTGGKAEKEMERL